MQHIKWQKILIIYLLLVIFFVLGKPIRLCAESTPTLDAILQNIQFAYGEAKTVQADFVQEVTIKSIGKTQHEGGEFYFKRPQRMLWLYERPQ
ncbi:MAG: outer membrane lipoprotein carrier protein LolA, partial [Deltaproteobacteria bacterium]